MAGESAQGCSINLWDIWTSGLWVDKADQANFYWPIFSTSIWLDQNLFGDWASGYHWHSLGWHWVNLVLFAQLCRKILPKPQQIIAVLIFATHPLLSEIVFWIAARNDLIALTFMLLFLNTYWKEAQSQSVFPEEVQDLNAKKVAVLGCLFLAAVLSKEVSLILLLPVFASLRKVSGARYLLGVQLAVLVLVFSWRSLIGVSHLRWTEPSLALRLKKHSHFWWMDLDAWVSRGGSHQQPHWHGCTLKAHT